jgi:uncharacterized protein (DUF3084 family)
LLPQLWRFYLVLVVLCGRGCFVWDQIQKDLRIAKAELEDVKVEKSEVAKALAKAKEEQKNVQKKLNQTNRSFSRSKKQLKAVSKQLKTLRSDLELLRKERQQLITQRTDYWRMLNLYKFRCANEIRN